MCNRVGETNASQKVDNFDPLNKPNSHQAYPNDKIQHLGLSQSNHSCLSQQQPNMMCQQHFCQYQQQ